MSCATTVDNPSRSTGEKHLFSTSVFVFYVWCTFVCWIFKLSAFADIVPLLCLWDISCVVQASEHLLIVRIFSLYGCLCWLEWKKSFIHAVVFSCGCSESEWGKMHLCHILRKCPGIYSSLRREGWKWNTGSFELTARTQCSGLWDTRHIHSEPGWNPICFGEGNPPVVLHKCTLGVLVPMEFVSTWYFCHSS